MKKYNRKSERKSVKMNTHLHTHTRSHAHTLLLKVKKGPDQDSNSH